MALAFGSAEDKRHLLVMSFDRALEDYTILSAVILPASSAQEAHLNAESLRIRASVAGSVTDIGVLKALEARFAPFKAALRAPSRVAQSTAAKSAYAIRLLTDNPVPVAGTVGSSSAPSGNGSLSASASLRFFCSSVVMDAVEQRLSVFFGESEPDHVKIIDWVLRQKLMVLTRFIFGKGPSLPAGEATVRLKECRPFLPEYWWDVLMGDQVDVNGAPFVPVDSAKHRVQWIGAQGAVIARQARSLQWHAVDFWGVHTFIEFVRYGTPQVPVSLFECFKSETSFMQVARVIDRFLTGFGWRPHCFSEATATSVISKYAVVAALRPVNPTAADSLAASVAGALLNVVTELVTQMTSAVQSDSTASVLPFMGKSVLGSLSSFAGQIRVVEAGIKPRGAGRNTTFPGTLSMDDVLARLKALEGADQGGALAVKRAAPADDFEGPWAGFPPLYAPNILPDILYACSLWQCSCHL